jgi:hypothetical protein
MDCGSGFPAANRFIAGRVSRGWKAAPTIKPTPKILKLTPICLRGSDGLVTVFLINFSIVNFNQDTTLEVVSNVAIICRMITLIESRQGS